MHKNAQQNSRFTFHVSRLCRIIVCILTTITSLTTLAHDPYEITSTASLYTNTLELKIEMEFRTALRLAGMNDESPLQTDNDLFRLWQPKLMDAAGSFFQITAGESPLRAEATNVTLGVENHIQFQLRYPQTETRLLRFAAAGLKPLEGQGPYGTTLTVLDMVNKKVVGQTVLFPTSPEIQFNSDSKSTDRAAQVVRVSVHQLTYTNAAASPPPTGSKRERGPSWPILVVAGLICVAVCARRSA